MKREAIEECCRGSILMEFILVLPIYFILMGGIFWIGDLLINRDHVLFADRLATAFHGLRHGDRDVYKGLAVTTFPEGTLVASMEQGRFLQHNGRSWSQTIGAKTTVYVKTPSWTHAWLDGIGVDIGKATNFVAGVYDAFGLAARESSYNYLNLSLMRTKLGESAYRSWEPANLCYEGYDMPVFRSVWYRRVYEEKYPSCDPEQLGDMSDVSPSDREPDQEDYARFPTYFLWSQ